MSTQPLSLEVRPVQRALAPGEAVTTYVLVRVRATTRPSGPAPRLTAVLVLDTSGSMGGEPIAQVIQSAQRLADVLDEGDALGVVAFASAARTVAPVRALTADARRALKREVAALAAGGGTNMSGGLAHAALLLPPRPEGERHVAVVLSDGQPNVGASTPEALGEEVRRVRQRGVAVSTLGFGAGHNEDLMIAVAEAGGGRYAFVNDPKLAGPSFARAVGVQRDIVAEDAAVVLAPAEGVEIVRVLGAPKTTFSAGGLRVPLGDVALGEERNVVVALRLAPPRAPGEGPWRPLRVTLAYGARGPQELRGEAAVALALPSAGDTDADAAGLVAIAQADELRTEARGHSDRRDFATAVAVLERAKALLAAVPGFAPGADTAVNDAYEAIVDDITAMAKAPDPEAYQQYRKAAQDYLDFGSSGAKGRGGGGLAAQSPTSQAMSQKMFQDILPPAALVVIEGPNAGVPHFLGPENDIGRTPNNAIVVLDPSVSRRHARVLFADGRYWLVDLKTTNGVTVNGQRVERWALRHGDVIAVGAVKLRFEEGR